MGKRELMEIDLCMKGSPAMDGSSKIDRLGGQGSYPYCSEEAVI